ncbi:protein kinase [bacterium]|nr:protein kinase [candidate division CSSED10-310 bacterium]
MDRSLLKTAKELYRNSDFLAAAELYEQAGDHEKAMDCYAQARMYRKAADKAIYLGRGNDAVTFYLRGGHVTELAEFFEARKNWIEAGKYYARAGKHDKAAEQYENLVKNLPERTDALGKVREYTDDELKVIRYAASAQAKAGNHRRAAALYERIGVNEEAGRNLLLAGEYRYAGEAFTRAGLCQDAGRAYLEGKLYIDAAQCFKADNNLVDAAEAYLLAKDYITAGDTFCQAGRFFKASIAYTDGNDIDKAIKALSMIQSDSPHYLDAVESIVELSYCKRYLTPVAKRFCDDYINRCADLNAPGHFDMLFKVAGMMEKSEYAEEAEQVFETLRHRDTARLDELKNQQISIYDTSDSKIDISEILKQDFAAEFRRKSFEERQEKLKLSSNTPSMEETGVLETDTTQKFNKAPVFKPVGYFDIQIGKKFDDRYLILEHLGSGGMGSVYKAHDLELDEDIAIKMLSSQLTLSETAIVRFKQEIKLARQINHSNIIRIFDFGDCGGLKYITMEYFKGKQLKECILEQGFLTIESGLDLVVSICDGLAAAHKLGIIHRDIKSHNIMISDNGNVKILDFGIAKSLESSGVTTEATILGTPEYMSPEAIQQKPVDARSDIYSLGIVTYEIFTGTVPFTGDSFLSVIHAHLEKDPPAPQSFNPDIPDDLVEVIMTCIQRNPNQRYRSVAELSAELRMIRMSL